MWPIYHLDYNLTASKIKHLCLVWLIWASFSWIRPSKVKNQALILRMQGLQSLREEPTSVISETTVPLLTPRCCRDLVISVQWLVFLVPTGKRSSEMIKWTFPACPMYSHCEYWMAFIKRCFSNQYLCDRSVITGNEKFRTNLVSLRRSRSPRLLEQRV